MTPAPGIKSRSQLPVLLLLLACLSAPGCAGFRAAVDPEMTPTRRWVALRNTVTDVQNLAMDLHEAGTINNETFDQAYAVCVAAREGLAFAQTFLPAGGDEFESTMSLVDGRIQKLDEELPDEPQ